jgi:predicted nucleic acid-binding protein
MQRLALQPGLTFAVLLGSPIRTDSPPDQAKRAARLIEGSERIGVSVVVLVETAHVLRTQYALGRADVVDALLGLITRENVEVLGLATRDVIEALASAPTMADRPIPDALILSMARAARALPCLYLRQTDAHVRDSGRHTLNQSAGEPSR